MLLTENDHLNENGSVSMSLMVLLPLLLSFLVSVIAIFFVMRTHSQNLHSCRTSLMRTESERLLVMRDLVALNPEARKLRSKRKATDKAAKAAHASKSPQAIAAAEAARATVIALQMALAAKQKSLLVKANMNAKLSLARLKSNLIRQTSLDQNIYEGDELDAINDVRDEKEVLGVVAEPVESLTPDYKPAVDFERRETMRVTWKFWPARLLPEWLKPMEPILRDFYIQGQCASTAEKKGNNQWRSRLTVDKRL